MILYHGTNNANLVMHAGLCLTDDADIAAEYGSNVHEVEVHGQALRVEVCREDRDEMIYPGDRKSELAAWAAAGWAMVRYLDETCNGSQHVTWRLTAAVAS
jgi:hypothetical protein